MKPLVSILIPAYNSEKWIHYTIKSALWQTWQRKEIIIVDDGSKDDTYNIAKKYESYQLKVVKQQNNGASSARNRALGLAQGDYIQWLDADNILAPDKISLQLNKIEANYNSRILTSSSWGKFYYRHNKAKFIPDSLWQDSTPLEWLTKKLSNNEWMIPESWLVSRKLTEMSGPWDERLSMDDDGEYFGRVIMGSEYIHFIPGVKSYYRIGNFNSLSSVATKSEEKMESLFLSMCMQIKYIRNIEDSERTRSACIKYLQGGYIFFFPENSEILEKANDLTRELGGKLNPPVLKWRYSIIQKMMGWDIAKSALFTFPKGNMLIKKNYDKLLYYLGNT